jgi:hypothetical protein
LTVRDLLGALAVLVVLVLVVGGLSRGCAFEPGGPRADPAAGPRVDAAAALRPIAAAAPFPVRLPAVPGDWRCTTVDTERIGPAGALAVRAGYLTPAGRYLRVVQSDATEEDLLASEAEGVPVARGAVDVAGRSWVTYADDTREPIRIAAVGPPVRLLITGSGTEEEFRTLAAAATGGDVLPR